MLPCNKQQVCANNLSPVPPEKLVACWLRLSYYSPARVVQFRDTHHFLLCARSLQLSSRTYHSAYTRRDLQAHAHGYCLLIGNLFSTLSNSRRDLSAFNSLLCTSWLLCWIIWCHILQVLRWDLWVAALAEALAGALWGAGLTAGVGAEALEEGLCRQTEQGEAIGRWGMRLWAFTFSIPHKQMCHLALSDWPM